MQNHTIMHYSDCKNLCIVDLANNEQRLARYTKTRNFINTRFIHEKIKHENTYTIPNC